LNIRVDVQRAVDGSGDARVCHFGVALVEHDSEILTFNCCHSCFAFLFLLRDPAANDSGGV
jgi:hypothetical protein